MGCSYGQINTFKQNEGKNNVVQWIALVRKMPVVRRSRLSGLRGRGEEEKKVESTGLKSIVTLQDT